MSTTSNYDELSGYDDASETNVVPLTPRDNPIVHQPRRSSAWAVISAISSLLSLLVMVGLIIYTVQVNLKTEVDWGTLIDLVTINNKQTSELGADLKSLVTAKQQLIKQEAALYKLHKRYLPLIAVRSSRGNLELARRLKRKIDREERAVEAKRKLIQNRKVALKKKWGSKWPPLGTDLMELPPFKSQ